MKVPTSSASHFSCISLSLQTAYLLRVRKASVALVLLFALSMTSEGWAQSRNRIMQEVDTSQTLTLPNHHPLWANSANSTGLVPADLSLNQLTLVLFRPPEQEAAFQ